MHAYHEVLTPEAAAKLVEDLPGKPVKDAKGNVIGEVTKAWVEDGGIRYEATVDSDLFREEDFNRSFGFRMQD